MSRDEYILTVNDMNLRKIIDFRKITALFFAVFGIYLCLRFSAECAEGIRKGILFCIKALVPSLFLFMALSSYIVKSGIAEWFSKPLEGLAKGLFGVSAAGLSVILLSMIGGYPVGARCAAALYEERRIGIKEAEKLVCITVCAGPGFLLNYVGGALLNNAEAGRILLFAELIGTILAGVIIGRSISAEPPHTAHAAKQSGNNLLISSVADASKATFHMCAMVVICSAFIEVISAVSPSPSLTDILSAFIEITTGCQRMCGRYPLYLIAFFVGFGGISVHLQIYAGIGKLAVNKVLFFLFRILQGIITAAAAYILLMIFPVEQSVFNSSDVPLTFAKSATLFGSGALVLSSLCFIGSVHQHQIRR